MTHQSSELLLLPCPRHSAHAAQSLGHLFPALCRTGAGLRVVLLGPPPPPRVAPLCSTASLVIRSGPTPAARRRPPFGFAPSLTGLSGSQARCRSPGSRACCFSTCTSSTTPRPAQARDVSPAADVAFHLCKQGRHAVRQFSRLNRPARRC